MTTRAKEISELGNTGFLELDANGNLGIGTTTPDRPLHITSTDNAPLKIDSSDSGQACIAYALNGTDIWYAGVDLNADGGEDFFIYDASAGGGNRLIIDSSGNVGIGTTSPAAKLEISSLYGTTLRLASTRNSNAWTVGDSIGRVEMYSADGTAPTPSVRSSIDAIVENTAGNSVGLAFKTYNDAERMRISSSGNVGIGNNTPTEKLEVYQTGADDAFIKLTSAYADGYDAGVLLNNTHTGGREYKIISTNNSRGVFGGGKLAIVDNTAGNNTDRFVINSSGNIGIGTSGPDAKLHLYSDGAVELRLTAEGSNDPSIFLTGETTGGYTNEGFKLTYDNSAGNTYFDNILDSATDSRMIFRTRASGSATQNVVMQSDGGTHFGGPLRLYNSTTDPSNPESGDTYYNTSDNQVYTWTGTRWNPLSNKFSASGGTENTYNNYKSHTFTSSGTFTVDNIGTVEYMIVAGGGGGGSLGGGGGAGGCIIGSTTVNPGNYTITVGGGGGNGGPGSTGSTGGNSSAIGITALGGGGGGSHQGGSTSTAGTSGGSGGGGSDNSGSYGRGTGTSGQGNNGGQGTNVFSDSLRGGGGGGGKGQAGKNFNVLVNGNYGNGGDGIQNDYINGTSYWFAGGGGKSAYGDTNNHAGDGGQGGGGGGSSTNGTGGNGGSGGVGYNNGGNGTTQISSSPGGSGGTNTGGGAGANAWSASGGAAGGSGIVVIRYTT